jgi:hypothetical protein
MSTTPLFDSIARRSDTAAVVPASPALPAPAPTSPLSAPMRAAHSTLVPAALVAAIEEIPAHVGAALPAVHRVGADQIALVEAVADAITRAVVDAVVAELDRITLDGIVRA